MYGSKAIGDGEGRSFQGSEGPREAVRLSWEKKR